VRSPDEATLGRLRAVGVASPDSFVDTFYGADNVSVDQLLRIVDELPEGTTELMCHPAKEDALLESLSSYTRPRYQERETLMASSVQDALVAGDVELVSSAKG
jgi:hypothetical protein